MTDLLEFVREALDVLGRRLFSGLRVLWWLIWDVCLEWLIEGFGWGCGRVLSLGRWPPCRINQVDQLSSSAYFVVLLLGAFSAVALGWVLVKCVF